MFFGVVLLNNLKMLFVLYFLFEIDKSFLVVVVVVVVV